MKDSLTLFKEQIELNNRLAELHDLPPCDESSPEVIERNVPLCQTHILAYIDPRQTKAEQECTKFVFYKNSYMTCERLETGRLQRDIVHTYELNKY